MPWRGGSRVDPAGPVQSSVGGHRPTLESGVPSRVIEVCLLGRFRVLVGSIPQADPGLWSLRALVALLAVAGTGGLSRAQAAAALWPDSLPSQAATNLRKALFDLNHRLPALAAWICSDARSLTWRPGADLAVDVVRFEKLAAQAAGEAELRRALAAYSGDLLPDCERPWAGRLRARLSALHDRLCRALALILEQDRRYVEALELVLTIARRSPADEANWSWALQLAVNAGGQEALDQVWSQLESSFEQAFADGPPESLSRDYLRLRQLAMRSAGPQQVGFVGRAREWASLRAAWDLSWRGQFGLVWIQRESGIGKSALALEFAHWMASQGTVARIGHASGVPGPTLEVVVSALRSGPLLPTLGPPWESELKGLLEPGMQAGQAEVQGPAVSEGARIRREMAAVEAMVADAPCLWVLDDLQDADQDSWDWIRLAARHLSKRPALLIAISRNDRRTIARRRDLFEAVGSAVACQLIAVGPLTDQEASSLVRQVVNAPPQIETELLALAQGNPLHLLEAARLWVLEKDTAEGLGVGPTMQATLARRLARLPSAQRRLGEALAVLGRPADPELLIRCTNRARQSSIEALLQTRIVTIDHSGRLRFHHGALAEAVLAQITPTRRRQLAGCLALALGEGDLRDQARLWEEAGDKGRAKDAYAQLATQAEAACQLEDAAFAYGKLVSLTAPVQQAELALKQADILYQAGAITEAEAAYRQTMHLAVASGALGLGARSRLGLARILSLGGDLVTAQVLAEDSEQTLQALGDVRQQAVALLCRGELVGLRQDFARAERLLSQARILAEGSADLPVAVQALNRLGDLRYERGQYQTATESYQQARQVAEQAGDLTGMLEAMGSLGAVLEETGKLVAGAGYQRELIELAYPRRLIRHLCYGLNNLGACYQSAGRWPEAERLVTASCRLALDSNDMRAISVTTGMLSLCRAEQQDVDTAERLSDLAMSLARAFPIPGYLALQICQLTDLLLQIGRPERVGALIEEAWKVRAAGTPHTALRLALNRIRWRHANGELSAKAARDQMLACARRSSAAESQALVAFRVWEVTAQQADRARALDLVVRVFEHHPHEWWQRCHWALAGVRPELPALPAPPDWVPNLALSIEDLLPWLDAYAQRHGSQRLAGHDRSPASRGSAQREAQPD